MGKYNSVCRLTPENLNAEAKQLESRVNSLEKQLKNSSEDIKAQFCDFLKVCTATAIDFMYLSLNLKNYLAWNNINVPLIQLDNHCTYFT